MLKLLLIDVDGVMCKGKYYNSLHQVVMKEFNDKDFTAIKKFKADGIPVVMVTGDEFNKGMATKRKIDYFNVKDYDTNLDKSKILPIICEKYKVLASEIAYVADSIYDVSLLKVVGYPFCPRDSSYDVDCVTGIMRLSAISGEGVLDELYTRCRSWFNLKGNFPNDNL